MRGRNGEKERGRRDGWGDMDVWENGHRSIASVPAKQDDLVSRRRSGLWWKSPNIPRTGVPGIIDDRGVGVVDRPTRPEKEGWDFTVRWRRFHTFIMVVWWTGGDHGRAASQSLTGELRDYRAWAVFGPGQRSLWTSAGSHPTPNLDRHLRVAFGRQNRVLPSH